MTNAIEPPAYPQATTQPVFSFSNPYVTADYTKAPLVTEFDANIAKDENSGRDAADSGCSLCLSCLQCCGMMAEFCRCCIMFAELCSICKG